MNALKSLLIAAAVIGSATSGFAQKAYAPFKYNAEDFLLTLNIKESPWVKKNTPVMQKHHRDTSDVTEWVGLFDIIVGMKDTDLSISGDLTFDSDEDIVKISAAKKEEADAVIKALKPVIASPQSLDTFLTDFETTLEKARKK